MARAEVASASVSSDSIKGLGSVDRKAGVSAAVDRGAGVATRGTCTDHRISGHDLRRRNRAGARPSPPGDRRALPADRGRRRLSGRRLDRVERGKSDGPARAPAAERARAHGPELGALARPADAGDQCRRRDRGRRAPPAGQQHRRQHDRRRAARSAHDRTPADRRARPDATAHHVRRRGRRAGNSARRRHLGLRDGAQPLRLERRDRDRASARRRARRPGAPTRR